MEGLFAVILMFLAPAVIALRGMFGEEFMKVLRGETEDRVKYVRKD
ncbi:MAG: hypothetical protein AAF416_08430 [Pseudomonadota bacterium]